ncbi:MAG: hypothetical protein MUE46_17850 [Xanthomonadales bacterium]|jgi:hypothetical protein|nr:hypothetical protein [Xanthomonadales bacterium]
MDSRDAMVAPLIRGTALGGTERADKPPFLIELIERLAVSRSEPADCVYWRSATSCHGSNWLACIGFGRLPESVSLGRLRYPLRYLPARRWP